MISLYYGFLALGAVAAALGFVVAAWTVHAAEHDGWR